MYDGLVYSLLGWGFMGLRQRGVFSQGNVFWPDTTLEMQSHQAANGVTKQYLQRSHLYPSEADRDINHLVYCLFLMASKSGHLVFMVLDHAEGKEEAYQRLGLAIISNRPSQIGFEWNGAPHLTKPVQVKDMQVADFTIV